MPATPNRVMVYEIQHQHSKLLPWRDKYRGHCQECGHTSRWTLRQRTAKTAIWVHVDAEHLEGA